VTALPEFCVLSAGRVRLSVHESFVQDIQRLGWAEPGALENVLLADPGAASGRLPLAVATLPGRSERIALRRLVHGGLLGPLLGRAYLGTGRATREIQVTAELRAAGAPVPLPVLAGGERIFGAFWALTVGTVFEEDTRDGLAWLAESPEPDALLRVARAAGRAVRAFHDAGGRHADLHIKNLLVRDTVPPEVMLIDLDRARMTPGLTPGERMAQIMRLFRSLLKREVLPSIGTRGIAAFFGAYCGEDRALRRALLRRVDRELRKVALHALRYRKSPT
jgi:tRNA A-37 threonylcarbamoyl transferase component Bud32